MKEEILEEIAECLHYADFDGVIENLNQLFMAYSVEECAQLIGRYIVENYTLYKAEFLAMFLEKALQLNKILALVEYPDNYIFRVAIATGSYEIYECFIEEAIDLEMNEKTYDAKQKEEYFLGLCKVGAHYNGKFSTQYHEFRKGIHYNSAMTDPNRGGFVHMEEADYLAMEETIANYNKIVGRRKILEDLLKKSRLM